MTGATPPTPDHVDFLVLPIGEDLDRRPPWLRPPRSAAQARCCRPARSCTPPADHHSGDQLDPGGQGIKKTNSTHTHTHTNARANSRRRSAVGFGWPEGDPKVPSDHPLAIPAAPHAGSGGSRTRTRLNRCPHLLERPSGTRSSRPSTRVRRPCVTAAPQSSRLNHLGQPAKARGASSITHGAKANRN